jgi:hypothetical protein
MAAARQTVLDTRQRVQGLGGVVLLSPDGVGLAFNTPRMAHAYRVDGQPLVVGINPTPETHVSPAATGI